MFLGDWLSRKVQGHRHWRSLSTVEPLKISRACDGVINAEVWDCEVWVVLIQGSFVHPPKYGNS